MTSGVATADLSLDRIPAQHAALDELIKFAHTFDGFQYAGSFARCAEIANKKIFLSTDDLRAALFFEARRWRHAGEDPGAEAMAYWRSLVERIRRRLEVIDAASPEWLSVAIRSLPAGDTVPKGTQGFNLYQTQKDHWLGWLEPSAGMGTYPRQTGASASARMIYNRIMEPKMLLWLGSAAGVTSERVAEASAAADRQSAFASKCAAVRKVLPWRVVADMLMADADDYADINVEAQDRQSATRAETLEPLLLKTARRWNIPVELAKEVILRDEVCVYCRQPFVGPDGPASSRASWEHIVNDLTLISRSNIALCCVGCNASKGTLPIGNWLKSDYCAERKIGVASLAAIAAAAVTAN